MGDLKNPKAIYLKAFLFLVAGTASALMLISQSPTLVTVFLLGITIWAFCRLYYFAFYVIEHYVDSSYRFSGLLPLLFYFLRSRARRD